VAVHARQSVEFSEFRFVAGDYGDHGALLPEKRDLVFELRNHIERHRR
jgi:hypothetical protein